MPKPSKPAKSSKSPQSSKRTTAAGPTPAAPRPELLLPALFLAMAACVLYAPSWGHDFVGDDSMVIGGNAWTLQGLSALPRIVSHSLYFGTEPQNSGLYRPVAGAYYVVVGALVGLHAVGYHIAQILLYGLNAALVFIFFTRLTGRSIALPCVATLLFIAHPIHTEVVDNIKSADEMLCLAFFLVSAIAWLKYADTADARWRYGSLAAYALAVCSKETALPMIVTPPALWYFFRDRTPKASLVAALPFLAVAAVYLAVRQAVFNGEPATNTVTLLNNALLATNDSVTRLASALAYLAKYFEMLVWPHPLSFDYTYNAIPLRTFADPAPWVAIAVCAAFGAVLITGVRRRRVEAFAVLWFAASMVLVSNLFFLISTNFGERLLYVPSVMVCYVAAGLLFKAARLTDDQPLTAALRSPVLVAPLLVVLSVGSVAAIGRTSDWRDQRTLFSADVQKYPNSARLNNFLGNLDYFAGDRLFVAKTDPEAATADFADAKLYLLRGLAIRDDFLNLHAVLGMAEYRLKQYREAIPHLERALAFKDYRTSALEMMADCYDQLQMPARALALYKQIDAEGISSPEAWFALGNDAAARGDDDASIRYFGKVIAATPENVSAYVNLALRQHQKGDYAGSLATAGQCLARQADDIKCLMVAADDLLKTGHPDQARAYVEKAKAFMK
jgi:tetratricopeptide (TPR) repeat protein